MKKLMYGKRLEGLEDNRLVKILTEKLKDARIVGQWEKYGALQRKYAITEEDQTRREWKTILGKWHAVLLSLVGGLYRPGQDGSKED